jgi:protein SCO1/2
MIRRALITCACLWLSAAALAHAPMAPADLDQRAGFDQRLGAQVPMELHLRESDGQPRSLRQVANGKPILLAMGYYRCPNLCDAVLHGMADAVAKLTLRPHQDFEVVFVSIDPRELPADAATSQRMLAREQTAAKVDRWHVMTGDEADIQSLARAIGFRYFLDPRNNQYAHAAGVVVLSAEGRVTQYMFGVDYPPRSQRLALVDASRGKLGGLVDQLVLLCCGYDPSTGRYSLLIGRVMQFIGIGFAIVLGATVWWLHRWRRTA